MDAFGAMECCGRQKGVLLIPGEVKGMIAQKQVYVCNVCGNMVEVVRVGGGTLACCGQPMTLLEENTTDAAQEKHVPVIERAGDEIKVAVGSVAHPMADDHFIEWVEVLQGDIVMRRFLKPGDAPEATFPCTSEGATARAYCNLHGLWKSSS